MSIPTLRNSFLKAHVQSVGSDGRVVLQLDDPAERREVKLGMEATVDVVVAD